MSDKQAQVEADVRDALVGLLEPDIVEDIRRIKSHDGPDLILSGSSTLTSTLLEQGLADEAGKLGATILLDAVVTGLHENHYGKWDGVAIENGSVMAGRYIIGADGCESKVGQWAGLATI